jgi:hypothetical protein
VKIGGNMSDGIYEAVNYVMTHSDKESDEHFGFGKETSMRGIVTHEGGGHFDDFASVSLALAKNPSIEWVKRRTPSEDDLEDKDILVLDVGERHEPSKNNFDHHQLERGTEECALSLYARHLDLHIDMETCFKWYRVAIQMDSLGPFATAGKLNISPDTVFQMGSPLQTYLISEWSKVSVLERHSKLWGTMRAFGEWIVYAVNNFKIAMADLSENILIGKVKDVTTINATRCHDESITWLNTWQSIHYPEAGISITNDDRGNGLTLYRFNDHPDVDFSVLEGEEGILFAHKGGFIAKTTEKKNPLAFLEEATNESEG